MSSKNNIHGENFVLDMRHYDTDGKVQPGKYMGPTGHPLISVDGPHAGIT